MVKLKVTETPVEKITGEAGPISPEQKAARRKAVESAFTSIAIDGGRITDDFRPVFDAFVEGEISKKEMTAEIDAITARLRQERDERQKQSLGHLWAME